jgi:hypothetical protein
MAKAAIGLTLELWDHTAGTPAYVTIGEIVDINGIGVTKEMIDVTHQGSANAFREKIAGLIETKPFSATLHLDYDIANASNSGNHDVLNTLAESRVASKARVRFVASGPNVVFDPCHVSDLTIDAPLGDKIPATITLTPSGKGTWAST